MKRKGNLKPIVTFIFLVFGAGLFAQSGEITGTVKDRVSGEPLVGAKVVVEATGDCVITDFDGKFTVDGLAPGKQNLTVSYISYREKVLEQIEVSPGSQVTLNINLTKVTAVGVKKKTDPFRPLLASSLT